MEDTFYALSCFAVCDEYFKDFETAEFVENLQNYNGGFRRSVYGGISTLEDTYYAVSILKFLRVL
ncbi:MAG: hypothetical protein QFX37_04470 [Archaeoglobales archaeon]|nr:hypothetical protein [Archaeoglobales archaeon]